MASVLPGFEYDIFISYRHNDNRSGWVTEFVKSLQEELAAAIKEPVSVYFDVNPHDGLLETHDVGKSLESKLNCLIFIPIISQTYCDPKSFAWQYEFCSFNKLAKEARFGRDVKLGNGNVASRILPVKIHDLDADDKATIENEIGGVMRAIEFIYKSSGVNRPLRSNEEEPKENLNRTIYRNQINKVANAVKEILTALKNPTVVPASRGSQPEGVEPFPPKTKWNSRFYKPVGIAAFILLVIAALFIWRRQMPGQSEKKYPYDVAVMYLENFTDNAKYGDQLASLVHINLINDTSLHVLPRQRLFDEMKAATGATTPDRSYTTDIARKTGVRTILTGSVHQQGELVLVQLELTEVETGKIIKAEKLEGRMDQIFSLADNICKRITATSMKKEFNVALSTTQSYEAYQKFYSGLEDFYLVNPEGASRKFKEAIALDSTFAMGYLFLAQTQALYALFDVQSDLRPPLHLIEKARSYSYKLSVKDRKLVDAYYALYRGDLGAAERIAYDLNKANTDDRLAFLPFLWLGFAHADRRYFELVENYLAHNPSDGLAHNILAYTYALAGHQHQAESHVQKYIELEPNTPNVFDSGFEVYMTLGKPDKALEYLEKLKKVAGRSSHDRRVRYLLCLAKAEELKSYFNLYKDSIPDYRNFQEMLPFSLALEGKFGEATRQFDGTILRFEKKEKWNSASFLRLHKGILLMASRHFSDAINVFDETIRFSRLKLRDEYNPCLLLANYYAGMAEVRAGNLPRAEQRLSVIKELLHHPMYDWRFKDYDQLLTAEIALSKEQFGEVKSLLENLRSPCRSFSMSSMMISYSMAWQTKDYPSALAAINPFYKNYFRSIIAQGGDPSYFTWERIFADYTVARIYEDAGNRNEAAKFYSSFLAQLKDSDPGIAEKEDAVARLKKLSH